MGQVSGVGAVAGGVEGGAAPVATATDGVAAESLRAGSGVRFAGYAAVFDAVDRGGDVVRAGAFAGASGAVGRVPLLWQHGGRPVGEIETLGEDARGLRVIARVDEPKLAALVAGGAVGGLSFGYRVKACRRGAVRELTSVELREVSLVARPMQPLARVHAVEVPGE